MTLEESNVTRFWTAYVELIGERYPSTDRGADLVAAAVLVLASRVSDLAEMVADRWGYR